MYVSTAGQFRWLPRPLRDNPEERRKYAYRLLDQKAAEVMFYKANKSPRFLYESKERVDSHALVRTLEKRLRRTKRDKRDEGFFWCPVDELYNELDMDEKDLYEAVMAEPQTFSVLIAVRLEKLVDARDEFFVAIRTMAGGEPNITDSMIQQCIPERMWRPITSVSLRKIGELFH